MFVDRIRPRVFPTPTVSHTCLYNGREAKQIVDISLLFIIAPLAGFWGAMIIDTMWFRIDYKKAEKGLEAHEHYHVGIELAIVGVILWVINMDVLAVGLFGMGAGFFMAEWQQKNAFALPAHPTAFHPNPPPVSHFKQSTILGVILIAIFITAVLVGATV